eukprot:2199983-Rhodomonas_salina.2
MVTDTLLPVRLGRRGRVGVGSRGDQGQEREGWGWKSLGKGVEEGGLGWGVAVLGGQRERVGH